MRPEVILAKDAGGQQTVGAIKLHFPKTSPLSEDAAGYVSAAVQMLCDHHLSSDGQADYRLCSVIDMGSARVYDGVRAIRQRIREIEATCGQIARLWPTITVS